MNGAGIKKRKDRGITTEPRVYPLKVSIHNDVESVANDVHREIINYISVIIRLVTIRCEPVLCYSLPTLEA